VCQNKGCVRRTARMQKLLDVLRSDEWLAHKRVSPPNGQLTDDEERDCGVRIQPNDQARPGPRGRAMATATRGPG
jgi:hypothetical protein